MKANYISTLLLCILFCGARAQQDTIQKSAKKRDSLTEKPRGVERVFYRDFTKRHEHIFDFESGFPFYTIGYNYYYNVKPYFKVGGRFGWFLYNFSKKRKALYCPSTLLDLKIEALFSFKIWRSINVELGIGYWNTLGLDIISGKASPPKVPRGGFCAKCMHGVPIAYRLDFSFTFWKHIFIRAGVMYMYDMYNFFFPNIGLGFQFNHH